MVKTRNAVKPAKDENSKLGSVSTSKKERVEYTTDNDHQCLKRTRDSGVAIEKEKEEGEEEEVIEKKPVDLKRNKSNIKKRQNTNDEAELVKGFNSSHHTGHIKSFKNESNKKSSSSLNRDFNDRIKSPVSGPKQDLDSSLEQSSSSENKTSIMQNVSDSLELRIPALTKSKAVGTYIPPARLKRLQEQIKDKNSEEYQRITWEALRKSINGFINKVNVPNIKQIIVEIFKENLIRGKGLYCRCIMKAQAASATYTAVYASLTAVINSKLPQVGFLLVKRLISQFKRGYKRGDKQVCLNTAKFLAQCVNQRLVHEILALQILMLLLENPTDSSVEVAVAFTRECGAFLLENSPKSLNTIFDRLRDILHEGNIEKRTQFMIEIIFQVRRDKFKDNPAIPEGLDLIEEDDQLIHMITLDDDNLDTEEECNVFKYNPNYLEDEEKYNKISNEILGGQSDSSDDDDGDDSDGDGDDSDGDDSDGDDSDGDYDIEKIDPATNRKIQIQDETDISNMNFRRAIYLTIMSSFTFEECAHKLLKLDIKPEKQQAFVSMLIECCSVERTYINMYGLVAERFCRINKVWSNIFKNEFERIYKTIHRFEINLLRNLAKFFAHLLSNDAISWEVFVLVRLTEADTTSSLRIFLKIIFQDIAEVIGVKKLLERIKDPNLIVRVSTNAGVIVRHVFDGVFPKDSPQNTRFAINYFTSIGHKPLTEDLREYLKTALKLTAAGKTDSHSEDSSSSYLSNSYYSGSSSSSSSSRSSRSSSSSCSSISSRSSRSSISSRSSRSSISSRSSRSSISSRPSRPSRYSRSPPPSRRQRSPRSSHFSRSFSRSPTGSSKSSPLYSPSP